jgi:hypothetical protein
MQCSSGGRRQISITTYCSQDFIHRRQFIAKNEFMYFRPNCWFCEIVVLFRQRSYFAKIFRACSCIIINVRHFSYSVHSGLPSSCNLWCNFSHYFQCHLWIFLAQNFEHVQHTSSFTTSLPLLFYNRLISYHAPALTKRTSILIYTLP